MKACCFIPVNRHLSLWIGKLAFEMIDYPYPIILVY